MFYRKYFETVSVFFVHTREVNGNQTGLDGPTFFFCVCVCVCVLQKKVSHLGLEQHQGE